MTELHVRDLHLAGRVNGVDLSFQKGALTAIVGPNGAGKSSLLGCIAGLINPTSGSITLGDSDVSIMPPRDRARQIGYLPQTPEIAWDVSVETLVSLGRLPWQPSPFHPSGSDRAEDAAAINAALSCMDLETLRSRAMSRLSGGERARALAARVLAGQPDWILADEPLANLDLAHASALISLLRKEARSGKGVIVILHDLATAMNHADRVIVLEKGCVAADGPPALALTEALVSRVWQVQARWLGGHPSQALIVGEPIKHAAKTQDGQP